MKRKTFISLVLVLIFFISAFQNIGLQSINDAYNKLDNYAPPNLVLNAEAQQQEKTSNDLTAWDFVLTEEELPQGWVLVPRPEMSSALYCASKSKQLGGQWVCLWPGELPPKGEKYPRISVEYMVGYYSTEEEAERIMDPDVYLFSINYYKDTGETLREYASVPERGISYSSGVPFLNPFGGAMDGFTITTIWPSGTEIEYLFRIKNVIFRISGYSGVVETITNSAIERAHRLLSDKPTEPTKPTEKETEAPMLEAYFTHTISELTVDFNASTSTGNIVEYIWDFGDGQTGSGIKVPHTYDKEGIYDITLTVKDDEGNTDIAKGKIELTLGGLKATSDKTVYITGEKIIIQGKMSIPGEALATSEIDLKIYHPDGTEETHIGPLTGSDGSFTMEYAIPKIPYKEIPPKSEKWDIEVTATPVQEGLMKATTVIPVTIVPIYLSSHGARLVQIIEPPKIDGRNYIASGREAVLRVCVSCPSIEGIKGATRPEIKVEMIITGPGTFEMIETENKIIDPEARLSGAAAYFDYPTPFDFFFTLTEEGKYDIFACIDPEFRYMDVKYQDDLWITIGTVDVKKMKDLSIKFVPIDMGVYKSNQDKLSQYLGFCKKQKEFIKDTYPLPLSNFKFDQEARDLFLKRGLHDLPLWSKYHKAIRVLNLKGKLEGCRIVGVTPDSPDWWHPGKSGVALAYLYSNAVLVKNGANEGLSAHEIGHTLGAYRLLEQYTVYPPLGERVEGLALKDGKITDLSYDPSVSPHYCFMGVNLGATWVCDETYSIIFKSLRDPPEERLLYVAGTIFKNDTVHLDNWYLMERIPDIPIDVGDYEIQCVSKAEDVLFKTNFGKAIGQASVDPPFEEFEFVPFGFTIPFPDETYKVIIKHGDKKLAEVIKTKNSPSVKLIQPLGGEAIDDAYEVRWSGEDKDGDSLSYSVLYSHDNGETWDAVALELSETNYEIDFSNLPGGSNSLIKIIATDGFNTGEDISDNTFTVGGKGPIAVIDLPEEEGEPQLIEKELQGFGFDLEDGEIGDKNLEWTSSKDGYLGTGTAIDLSDLSQGKHEITLKITDSDGNISEDKVTLTITKEKGSGLINAQVTQPSSIMMPNINFILILIIVGLVVGVVVMLKKRPKQMKSPPSKKKLYRAPRRERPIRQPPEQAYCTECGGEIPKRSKYCPICGTEQEISRTRAS